MENAKDLFAGVSIKDKDASTGGGGGGVLDSMTVTTRADFDKYLAALTAKIATFEVKRMRVCVHEGR